jgi:putative membrane protein insertion efficiency factor
MTKEESRMQDENAPRRVRSYFFILPSAFCILLVHLYRLTLSPLIAFLAGPAGACRFEPSCSQYAVEALKTHGAVTGGWLAAKRICRCHPGGACGKDPVPPVESKVPHFGFRI